MTQEGSTPSLGVSLIWQTLNVVLQVALQLVYMALLARWIAPEDFGVMAIALVVVGVVEIFAQVGIGPSIVQQPNLTPSHIDMLMDHCQCTRNAAVKALRACNDDMVTAVLQLQ